jgi:mRNA interferase RelE/StbE
LRTLSIDKATLKELDELPAKQYRQVVSAIFDLLKEPLPQYSKSLVGSPYLRLSLGEYRVIYRFDDASVTVVVFGKRNDGEVYKALKQKN